MKRTVVLFGERFEIEAQPPRRPRPPAEPATPEKPVVDPEEPPAPRTEAPIYCPECGGGSLILVGSAPEHSVFGFRCNGCGHEWNG